MRATVESAGAPWAMASTAAGSASYSRAHAVQARSTAASDETRVPSMSNKTARISRSSIVPSIKLVPRG
jgi:hypothetical protein